MINDIYKKYAMLYLNDSKNLLNSESSSYSIRYGSNQNQRLIRSEFVKSFIYLKQVSDSCKKLIQK